jgi:hypothetical protein
MITLNFHPGFISALDSGEKTRTIRKNTKLKPGDVFSLGVTVCSGEKKIRDVTCTRVCPVVIDSLNVFLDGEVLYPGHTPAYAGSPDSDSYDYDFARADGFDSFSDMVDFFEELYGLPFEGQLIEWKL